MTAAGSLLLALKMFVLALVAATVSTLLFGHGLQFDFIFFATGRAIALWALAFVIAVIANLVGGRKMPVRRYAAWWGCTIVVLEIAATLGTEPA